MLLRILNFNIKGTLLYSRAYKIQMHTLKSCIKVMLVPELLRHREMLLQGAAEPQVPRKLLGRCNTGWI